MRGPEWKKATPIVHQSPIGIQWCVWLMGPRGNVLLTVRRNFHEVSGKDGCVRRRRARRRFGPASSATPKKKFSRPGGPPGNGNKNKGNVGRSSMDFGTLR